MIVLEEFLRQLYVYLIGKDDINNNIIRKHTNRISILGDLSIPKDISNWKNLLNDNPNVDNLLHFDEKHFKECSKQWILHVDSCLTRQSDWYLFLDKPHAFCLLIKQVLDEGKCFGSSDVDIPKLHLDKGNTDTLKLNLTELRMHLTQVVVENVVKFLNCWHDEVNATNSKLISFTSTTCTTTSDTISIICNAVLNDKKKNLITTSEEFYRKRAIDMRLMAEHKYGLRITSQLGWQEFYEKLSHAAVTMELLQNKPNRSVTISLVDNTLTNNKGASFIMYNCARIAKLLKEFDAKVSKGFYPKLPDFDCIDFNLLTQQEEWQLLYIHIMQFPLIIKTVIKDILMGKVYPHYIVLALSSLCSTFSIYYRRIKILTESKNHMIPTLFARIYLLKAVEQVLHNGLYLLSIEPVKQM